MAAAGGGGGGGASGGVGADVGFMTLNYEDVVWDRNKRGNPVILGRGAFGIVYTGRLHGQPVAIKAEVLKEGEEVEAWLKAARLHYTATCPHIVSVHGIIVDHDDSGTTHHLVMERLAGTMTDLLLKPGGAHYGADMELRLALLADVASGLAYLHAASVIHADVKPDNVLLTAPTRRFPNPAAKLADFGSSVQRRVGTRTRGTLVGERGTLVYMDPVLLDRSASITAASDVYSFGIMAWQVLSGLQPYKAEMTAAAPTSEDDAVLLLKAHVCGPRGKRPPAAALVERCVPPVVVALVQACWAPTQASRPAMAAVQRALEAAATAAETWGAGGSGGGVGRGPVAAPAFALAPPTVPPAALPAAPPAAPMPAVAPIVAAAPVPTPAPLPAPVTPVTPVPLAYKWDAQLELHGHNKSVLSLALLPGGGLASGSNDGTVRLWDAARGGAATAVLEGHGGHVVALAALPDGRRLAAGVCSSDRKLGAFIVWDTGIVPPTRCATIDCVSGVWALAVLSDGRLAAGCYDGGVRLVEVGADGGAVVATLKLHYGIVCALAVLPDGTLASGSHDHTVRLWDVGPDTCVATLEGHSHLVYALAVLADGRLASGSWDNTVRLWDVATRACVGVLEGHTNWANALAALPDGRLASGSVDKTIRVWDTRLGILASITRFLGRAVVLKGHTDSVTALQLLPGGRLASGSDDKTVRLWRLPP